MVRILLLIVTFLSAFLLFQIQPMVSKYLLPWYGGVPAVWTSCMLFFQVFLLCGYSYAHLITIEKFSKLWQLHVLLLIVSFAFLPILPDQGLSSREWQEPSLQILIVLGLSLGLPFFLLSATAPLLQVWAHRLFPSTSPYRLYALSNFGSLFALLSYPTLVEPLFPLSVQERMWSVLYVLFVICVIVVAILSRPRMEPSQRSSLHQGVEEKVIAIDPLQYVLWIVLSAVGVMLMLSITNELCQDVASTPFLWIAPLSIYLITYVIVFKDTVWYRRRLFLPLYLLLVPITLLADKVDIPMSFGVIVLLHLLTLFVGCMLCHGELAKSKPPSKKLTHFYLSVSLGGALGGIFVGGFAPFLFDDYLEFPLSLLWCAFALIACFANDDLKSRQCRPRATFALGMSLVLVMIVCSYLLAGREKGSDVVASERNFFGVLRIRDRKNEAGELVRELSHGDTVHGQQYLGKNNEFKPTTYYTPTGAMSIALKNHDANRARSVGVIGLGAGVVAAFGNEGDEFQFIEIDPAVEKFTRKYFSFIEKSKARVSIQIGDGRKELENLPPQNFDVLLLDAFSGVSIPVHLLTQEAFGVYLRHLSERGVLVVHISNRHLNLVPVARGAAIAHGMSVLISRDTQPAPPGFHSINAIMSRDERVLQMLFPGDIEQIESYDQALHDERGNIPTIQTQAAVSWTDDYSNLFGVLR